MKSDYTFNEYEHDAMRTNNADNDDFLEGITNAALGAAGEAGEFADLVKKHRHQKHELDRDKVVKELGDILWYVAKACYTLEVSMSDVAWANIEKLKARYPNGFEKDKSINRAE